MDTEHQLISVDSEPWLPSTSRFICHEGKSPTSDLSLPSSWESGIRIGHILNLLESMGNNLPLSSIIPNFESFKNTGILPRQSHFNYFQRAQPILVSSSLGQINPTFSILNPCLSQLVSGWICFAESQLYHSLIMWILWRRSILSSIPQSQLIFWSKHLRGSTTKQYDSAWSSFCNFLCLHELSKIITKIVFFFLRFLFLLRGLAPLTISGYKSALA